MTFTKAAHRRHVNKFFTAVKQRGKGKIQVLQPGMGDPDWVTEVWLKEHRINLPPGSVVTLPDGREYKIKEQP